MDYYIFIDFHSSGYKIVSLARVAYKWSQVTLSICQYQGKNLFLLYMYEIPGIY